MKKIITLAIKIVMTISLVISGLVALTNWRLHGLHIFGIYITAEQVNMFVDSSGTYLYLVFIAIVILVIWGVWIGRAVAKKK